MEITQSSTALKCQLIPSLPAQRVRHRGRHRSGSSALAGVQIPAQGTEHSTELQMILTQEIPDKGPRSSPAPLQWLDATFPSTKASTMSTETTQRKVTSRILQEIDFS